MYRAKDTHVIHVRREFWVLANCDERLAQGQHEVYIASWTAQFSTKAVRSKELTKHIATRGECYTVNGQAAVRTSISGRFRPLPEVRPKPSEPPTDCTGATVKSLCIIESEEMILPRGPNRLCGSRNIA